jgi:3-hydroxyacyl-CoA dehydrogenase
VAAITGNALGGACELVLAAHARVAHVGARLGLPEVSLGLLPGAGATQRLPRLVGAQVALKILLDGLPLNATEALAVGLLDRVVETAPLRAALALAEKLASGPLNPASGRREGLRNPQAYQAAISAARLRVDGWRLPAPARLIDCVEAAQLLPFDQALEFEHAAYVDMATSPEAQALRHAFLAERRALFAPQEVSAVAPPHLATVAVIGASGAAPEVARLALMAGLQVKLMEADRPSLAAALEKIAARLAALLAEKHITPAQHDAAWARLGGLVASDGLEAADLVLLSPDAPRLASYPAPTVMLGGKGALVLHPAPGPGGLAELSVTPGVPVQHQALALGFGRRLGWKVMVQGPGASIDQRLRAALSRAIAALEAQGTQRATIASSLAAFGLGAGARMKLPALPAGADHVLPHAMAALITEGLKMLQEGAARRPADIDAATILSGLFPRWAGGPMYHADQMGLMALRADLRIRAEAAPKLFTPPPLLDTLIAEGNRFGDLNRG